ncbi:MAG: DUF3618 domain-containing protein [Solirubrobacterales bacterium]
MTSKGSQPASGADAEATKDNEGESKSPEEIQAEIEATRDDLGDTVAAVAGKADVKKQATAKASDVKASVGAKTQEAKDSLVGAKDSLAEKAGEATPESTSAGAQRAQQLAKENPVPLAIAGAFVAGFAISRLLSR